MNWDEIPNVEVPEFDFGQAQPDLLSQIQGIPRGVPKQPKRRPSQETDEPAPQPVVRRSFATGANSMMNHGASGAYHAAIGSAQQGKVLGDMISRTMGAYQDENDSRVSQQREMRRMMHEQELERMRQETERMKTEALLKRLEMESGGGRRVSFPGGSISHV